LQDDSLSFFRDYLRELGADIPEVVKDEDIPDFEEDPIPRAPEPQKVEEEEEEEEVEEEQEEEEEVEEEEEKEEADPDVIAPEQDPPQPMGTEFEVTDELREKAQELRQQANEHVANGELNEAVEKLTEAITKCNPSSAPLHASRGQLYLKLKKPLAAIRDGEAAIRINPDSATGYRVRGKARALIGEWESAAVDLRNANQRDYDPDINELLKTVSAKAQVVIDKRKKKEEKQRARQAKSKSKSKSKAKGGAAFPGAGFPGTAGIPPNIMEAVMSDPDFLTAMQDPTLLPILSEISTDPSKIEKYRDHPKLSKLISKFSTMFGKQ